MEVTSIKCLFVAIVTSIADDEDGRANVEKVLSNLPIQKSVDGSTSVFDVLESPRLAIGGVVKAVDVVRLAHTLKKNGLGGLRRFVFLLLWFV